MIQIVCNGNIGADAVRKEINGKMYISFRMGVRGRRDTTTWVSVLYRDNDKLLPYLVKGQGVLISGEPTFGAYVNREGKANVDVSVFANTLDLMSVKEAGGITTPAAKDNGLDGKTTTNNTTQAVQDDLPF